MAINVSFLQELLTTVADQGRQLLDLSRGSDAPADAITGLTDDLVFQVGEASGVALACQILEKYKELSVEEKRAFFRHLAENLQPDEQTVRRAAEAYLESPGEQTLRQLASAVESPRQEFFRRLNLAPGATAEIVAMRAAILREMKTDSALSAVDADLKHLLHSWFNRGFLVLRHVDWQTPAAILEKIIAYEAVHEIDGFKDLRRRLDPADRRCFAFFHPALIDEPLIFVEVALTTEISSAIGPLITEPAPPARDLAAPTTAVFYSISNCQAGLAGISFGNFLIKQVVEDLARELPSLKTFVTLSPVPTFARWLDRVLGDEGDGLASVEDRNVLQLLSDPGWVEEDTDQLDTVRGSLMALAAHYFLRAKRADGQPVDPVARFHLGNGARLERLNWLGDVSEKGLREAHGLMVNYRYELKDIERNHEAYVNSGEVIASRAVRSLLRPEPAASGLKVLKLADSVQDSGEGRPANQELLDSPTQPVDPGAVPEAKN